MLVILSAQKNNSQRVKAIAGQKPEVEEALSLDFNTTHTHIFGTTRYINDVGKFQRFK